MSKRNGLAETPKNDEKGGISAPTGGQKIPGREIKFRQAITEEDGTFHWHYWGYLHTCTKGMPVFINPRPPLEHDLRPSYQYIGLRDRTSAEIYRGGIIKGRCTVPNQQGYMPFVGVVKRNERNAMFYVVGKDTEGHLISRSFEDVIMSELEVIGNTEENPGLLKAEYEAEKAS